MNRFSRVNEWVIASCVALSVVYERGLLMLRGPEPVWLAVVGWVWTVLAVRWCLAMARERGELKDVRDICRRCAGHLNNECHTGIKDIETHRELAAELERAGWTKGGKER